VRITASMRHSPASRSRKSSRQLHGLAPGTRLVGAFPRLAPGPERRVDRMEVEFLGG
jgi:hypothetical protein